MRASRAEIGCPRGHVRHACQHALELADALDLGVDVLGVTNHLEHAFADRNGNIVGIERALDREQPLAAFVALAHHHGLPRGSVKRFTQLAFEQRPLLLDDNDHIQAIDELGHVGQVERPRTGNLVKPDPDLVGPRLVNAQIIERLAHIEIILAHRQNANPGVGAARIDDPVEAVRANIGAGGIALEFMQPHFLTEEIKVIGADVEPAGRHGEVRQDDLEPVEPRLHRRRRFHVVLDAFERRPGSRETRHCKPVQAVIDHLLHAGRIEDRNHRVNKIELGLVRVGRAFRRMVVAHQRQHASMLGRAGKVCVTKHVARPVHARPLAVPQRKHAIILAGTVQARLLRSPACCRCQFLVQSGLKHDVVLAQ